MHFGFSFNWWGWGGSWDASRDRGLIAGFCGDPLCFDGRGGEIVFRCLATALTSLANSVTGGIVACAVANHFLMRYQNIYIRAISI